MHTVAAIVDQGALTFDFAIPCEVFGLDRSDIASPWYEFLVVAAGDRRVLTQTGFVLEAPLGLDALDRADTIVVPGWSSPKVEPSDKLVTALRRAIAATRASSRSAPERSCSPPRACSTAVARRRTGCSWTNCESGIRVSRSTPVCCYVVDGTIMTSAGTAAGIDLCLHIVTADYGADVAAAVSRRMLMPLHRSGGQAQYVDTPVPQALGDEMTELLAWAVTRIPTGLSVDDLARRAAVSPRTLTRRFRRATVARARRVAAGRAATTRPAPARDVGRLDRARRAERGLRHAGRDARALRAPPAHVAARVPADLPRRLNYPPAMAGIWGGRPGVAGLRSRHRAASRRGGRGRRTGSSLRRAGRALARVPGGTRVDVPVVARPRRSGDGGAEPRHVGRLPHPSAPASRARARRRRDGRSSTARYSCRTRRRSSCLART